MESSEETNILKMISIIYRKTQMYLSNNLSAYGLTSGLATFLMITCEHGIMVQNQFCDLLDMSKGTVAKSLAKLEALGYVHRSDNNTDGRSVDVCPTQKALDLYPMLRNIGDHWTKQLSKGLTANEQTALFQLLEQSTHNACSYFEHKK